MYFLCFTSRSGDGNIIIVSHIPGIKRSSCLILDQYWIIRFGGVIGNINAHFCLAFLKLVAADWSFIEKTSVMQDPKLQVCSNFQMSLLHLSQMDPQWRHLIATIGTQMDPVDLSSDIPPGRGIWWPTAVPHQVSLTFCQPLVQAGLWSDVTPSRSI